MSTTHSVLEFGIHIVSKVTSSAGEHIVDEANQEQNRNFDACSDFARRDPSDHIYEEYESVSEADLFAWKRKRPAFYKSVLLCAITASRVILLTSGLIGVVGLAVTFVILNTMYHCDWMEDTDPKLIKSVRITRNVLTLIGDFYIDHIVVLISCMVFTWAAIRRSRILVVNTIFVVVDISYRVILLALHKYRAPFIPYPVNVFSLIVVLHHSYAIGKQVFPRNNKAALAVATKLCTHLIAMVITMYIFNYAIFPRFLTLHGVPKLLLATIAPIIFLPTKLLGRLCVLRLQGVIHPSTSFVLVSIIYAMDATLARQMQADFIKMKMFVIYGVLHGTIHVLETLVISTMGQKFHRPCCRKKHKKDQEERPVLEVTENPRPRPFRSPRAQRLAADMSLQTMLLESLAIILTTGLTQMYAFVYQPYLSPEEGREILIKLLVCVFIALFTEFFFHSVSILLQTRYLNVPVVRVWEAKWRLHLWVTISTTLLCVVYFTPYFLPVVREKYKSEGTFNETCTIPFQ